MTSDMRADLQGRGDPLRLRLRTFLDRRQVIGAKPLLVVLDDFERNTPEVAGRPLITTTAQEVMVEITPLATSASYVTPPGVRSGFGPAPVAAAVSQPMASVLVASTLTFRGVPRVSRSLC